VTTSHTPHQSLCTTANSNFQRVADYKSLGIMCTELSTTLTSFDILLIVHLSLFISVINQLDAQNFCDADPSPLLVLWSRKSRAIPLLPLWAVWPVQSLSACTTVHFTFTCNSTPPMDRTACTEPQCLYNSALYLYLYLYSPYGPRGLYIASVPVQRCSLSLPIPLLPLWSEWPVQNHSALFNG